MTNADTAKAVSKPGDGYRPSVTDPMRKRAMRVIKGSATFEDRFFSDFKEAVTLVEELRSMGCVIGFTTGVWDLFHIGHAQYIAVGKQEVAKHYPDAEHVVMVVGVDADALARGRKGEERPIVPLEERCKILSHMRAVDIIVAQNEANQLYKSIPYNARIISKSTGDLPDRAEIERYCEHLVELEPQATISTTARVRQLTINGAGVLAEKIMAVIREELRGPNDPGK